MALAQRTDEYLARVRHDGSQTMKIRRLDKREGTMWSVLCRVLHYVDKSSQPPIVEAELIDAQGVTWHFVDKEPIFLSSDCPLPTQGHVRCILVNPKDSVPNYGEKVLISTASPDSVEAVEQKQNVFEVWRSQLCYEDE